MFWSFLKKVFHCTGTNAKKYVYNLITGQIIQHCFISLSWLDYASQPPIFCRIQEIEAQVFTGQLVFGHFGHVVILAHLFLLLTLIKAVNTDIILTPIRLVTEVTAFLLAPAVTVGERRELWILPPFFFGLFFCL